MPVIPIDFSNVESYDNLPIGKYFGQVDKVELRPKTDPSPDKYDQIQAQYLVVDGELLGRKQSEFMSMSPKSAFRLKKWFDKFGLAEGLEQLEFDDETNLLLEPDLVAVNVIFEVYEDPKLYQGERQVRTRLIEVLDDDAAPDPEPVKAPVKAAAAGASVSPQARAAAARPADPVAVPVEVDEEVEEEEPESEEPVIAAVAPRRFSRSSAATATGPARRQLR